MNIAKLLFSSLLAVFMLFFCFSFSVKSAPPPQAPTVPAQVPPSTYPVPQPEPLIGPEVPPELMKEAVEEAERMFPQLIQPQAPAEPTVPTVPTFPQLPTIPTIPEISPYQRTSYAPQYPAYPTYQAYEYPPTQPIQPQPVVVTGEGYFQNIIKDIQDLGISPAVMHGIIAGVISLGIGSLLFYFSKSELVGLIGIIAGISISAVIFSELLWIAFLVGMVTIMGITIKIMK
jgi:hypothetical protein